MPHRRTTAAFALLAFALLAALSCRSSDAARPLGEVAFDVTTVLDTFSTEIGSGAAGYLSPECPNDGYCTVHRANSDGRLSGVLYVSGRPKGPISYDASGSFSGLFCSATDWHVPSACVAVSPVAIEYSSGTAQLVTPDVQGRDSIAISLTNVGTTAPPHLNLLGRFDGDSIVGRVYWSLSTARSPNSYNGSFVARPRR